MTTVGFTFAQSGCRDAEGTDKPKREKARDKISITGSPSGIVAIVGGQILKAVTPDRWSSRPPAHRVWRNSGAVLLQSPFHIFRRGIQMARWIWVPP